MRFHSSEGKRDCLTIKTRSEGRCRLHYVHIRLHRHHSDWMGDTERLGKNQLRWRRLESQSLMARIVERRWQHPELSLSSRTKSSLDEPPFFNPRLHSVVIHLHLSMQSDRMWRDEVSLNLATRYMLRTAAESTHEATIARVTCSYSAETVQPGMWNILRHLGRRLSYESVCRYQLEQKKKELWDAL